ncbi:hypothetical protein ACFXJ5_32305 [Streptomyces sp. NPDC059373]
MDAVVGGEVPAYVAAEQQHAHQHRQHEQRNDQPGTERDHCPPPRGASATGDAASLAAGLPVTGADALATGFPDADALAEPEPPAPADGVAVAPLAVPVARGDADADARADVVTVGAAGAGCPPPVLAFAYAGVRPYPALPAVVAADGSAGNSTVPASDSPSPGAELGTPGSGNNVRGAIGVAPVRLSTSPTVYTPHAAPTIHPIRRTLRARLPLLSTNTGPDSGISSAAGSGSGPAHTSTAMGVTAVTAVSWCLVSMPQRNVPEPAL